MGHKGVTSATRWAAASGLASLLMLLISAAAPAIPLWPFLLTNWLIFAPGGLVVFRIANNEGWNLQVMHAINVRFLVALVAFAVCGHLAFANSNSLIHPNDQLTSVYG